MMRLLDVNSWSKAARWILFIPIPLLVILLFTIVYYIVDILDSRSTFFIFIFIQLVSRPLMAYIAMTIIPKGKKFLGYLIVALNIVDIINITVEYSDDLISINYYIGDMIGILVTIVMTFILIGSWQRIKVIYKYTRSLMFTILLFTVFSIFIAIFGEDTWRDILSYILLFISVAGVNFLLSFHMPDNEL